MTLPPSPTSSLTLPWPWSPYTHPLRCGTEPGPWDWPGPRRSFLTQGVVPRSPHGSWVPPVTPVKLDASGLREPPSGQSPPARHSHPSWDSLHHAGQGPKGSSVGRYHDATTITDLCSCGNVPEVEIISLLGEQLPHYTLRADTLFGYEHDDWLHTPLLPPEAPTPLTPQQIEETLKYFRECRGAPLGASEGTWGELALWGTPSSATHRQDLQLRRPLGDPQLRRPLGDPQLLESWSSPRPEELELRDQDAAAARQSRIFPLLRELALGCMFPPELGGLRGPQAMEFWSSPAAYAEVHGSPALVSPTDLIATELEEETEAPLGEGADLSDPAPARHADVPACTRAGCQEQGAAPEGVGTGTGATSITTETCQYEDQEQQLMLDCVEQFSSRQVASLSEELARKTEDTARQQEEISQLLAQIVDLQQKCRTYGAEVEELHQHLAATKESQQKLRTELQDLQEKYAECEGMLHEAQEEIKTLRTRNLPNSSLNRYSLLPLDSLAAEIKGIMRKGADSSSASEYKSYKRVFETVKVVNQAVKAKSRAESPQNLPGSKPSSALPSAGCSRVSTPRTSYYGSDSASLAPENLESALGEEKLRGTPGTPGRHDLEAALQRLSARQENHASERSFFETEREQKLNQLARDVESSSGFLTPNDSILSTGTNYSGSSEHTGGSGFSLGSLSYLPDKLQIVKPLEGSVTLHHWQQLAKPNLGGILDPRPGVLTKDFRQLDVDLEEVYNLNDLEEDDVDLSAFPALAASTPSKAKGCSSAFHSSINNLPQTPSTFTITTCHILHPSKEITTVTPSLYNTVVPSCGPFDRLSAAGPVPQALEPGPRALSAPLGLVTLLLEHGISASVRAGNALAALRAPEPPSWLSPLREQWDSLGGRSLGSSGLAQPFPRAHGLDDGRAAGPSGAQSKSNIFSWNLVEKLKRLRLDKVVARGEASFRGAGERRQPVGPPAPTTQP
ncbi:trafficking kinesin-binding protein 1-like [Terrapene carolina triunguis]|uniref:trafficking kinesin-binding protein 1-like n=1 Tax=Terrapene triunguis TaxID=2587831 RepID=UPI0011569203|nr:trafficking kinesin-binding protein 1-like [Terrapene carolina triunguis]